MGVRSFACAKELATLLGRFAIKAGSPFDELGDTMRAFFDERLCSGLMDEAVAGRDGVFEMVGHVMAAFGGYGDSALRVVSIGFAEGFFGDDQDMAAIGEGDGGAEARYACSDDEVIDSFCVRHNL